MTRRLEPQERIDELGGASVPFPFDLHAMLYSDNAPELENSMHQLLAERRMNLINPSVHKRHLYLENHGQFSGKKGLDNHLYHHATTPNASQAFSIVGLCVQPSMPSLPIYFQFRR